MIRNNGSTHDAAVYRHCTAFLYCDIYGKLECGEGPGGRRQKMKGLGECYSRICEYTGKTVLTKADFFHQENPVRSCIVVCFSCVAVVCIKIKN